jgi:hypothetical protein
MIAATGRHAWRTRWSSTMPERRYEVRVTGRLSQRAQDAFAGMDVAEVTAETVISGVVHQDDGLHQLLDVVQSLGLHVVSVQQVAS